MVGITAVSTFQRHILWLSHLQNPCFVKSCFSYGRPCETFHVHHNWLGIIEVQFVSRLIFFQIVCDGNFHHKMRQISRSLFCAWRWRHSARTGTSHGLFGIARSNTSQNHWILHHQLFLCLAVASLGTNCGEWGTFIFVEKSCLTNGWAQSGWSSPLWWLFPLFCA